MNRPPACVCQLLSFPGVAAALFVLALGGCYTNDTVDPDPGSTSTGPFPVLTPEPPYSPGHANTVAWSLSADEKIDLSEWEFLTQRSSDPLFAREMEESGWISGLSFEFTGLEHGSTHHYRVRGRNPHEGETEWSARQTSTQDAVAPVAALDSLKVEQTSLLFTFELSATDETSGIREIELWFRHEGGDITRYGEFPPGEISFQAAGGGNHEFFPVAVDGAGNRQDRREAPDGVTLVPEPIIITDSLGEEYDITSAVLEYRMAVEYWGFGLGRNTIRPIINPRMVGPGEHGYPDPNHLTDVCGVKFGNDARAYKIHDLDNREVVDDLVNGVPIAVCY